MSLYLLKEFRREQTRELPNRGRFYLYYFGCLGSGQQGVVIQGKGEGMWGIDRRLNNVERGR